jgi:hypothetical protein
MEVVSVKLLMAMEVVKMLVLTLFLVAKALSDNRRDKMSIE